MKKIFFFAASLLAAGSLMANVTVDLSNGTPMAETGATSLVNYQSGVCTATLSATAAYKASGVEFTLAESISAGSITSISGQIMCDATSDYMELAIYVRDENGNRWWSGTALSPYLLSEWTAFSEVPSKSYWDAQKDEDYPKQNIVSVGISLSPGVVVSNYKVAVKEMVINSGTTGLNSVTTPAAPAQKMMIDGKMMIMRDGKSYNVLGF